MDSSSKTPLSAKKLPKGIWVISIAMMFISMSAMLLTSIFPFYITQSLGLSFAALGVIEGIAMALTNLANIGSGFVIDLFKRKKITLLIGVALATIAKPLFLLTSGTTGAMLSRSIEGFSYGLIKIPSEAYCANESKPTERGFSLGLLKFFRDFGSAIGLIGVVLMGGWLMNTDTLQFVSWFTFCLGSFSFFITVRYVKEKRHTSKTKSSNDHSDDPTSKKTKISDSRALNSRYWSLILITVLFLCSRFSDSLLAIHMQESGAPQWLCLSIFGIFHLISALACLPIGRLSDRVSRSRMLYVPFVSLLLANICLVAGSGIVIGFISVLLWGIQRGTSHLLIVGSIADEVPNRIVGTALSIYYIVSAVFSFLAGALSGYLANVNLQYAFIFSLFASLIPLIALFIRNKVMSRVSISQTNGNNVV